ncbi:hypothetical protein [Planktothricoides raciborskii]|uniref:Secreted protein n=1 Tax=Planktothricoides raciborskii GIHE-MW2 TaxID=2792601 RepID=A0AAU8JKE9_9CYAN
MNRKAVILLLGTVLAVSGAVLKGDQNANANLPETSAIEANHTSINPQLENFDIVAQYGGSPWGQVASTKTYRNPDTGQVLCFYSSGFWAPCPGQGDYIIIPENAQCRGSQAYSLEYARNICPAAQCARAQMDDSMHSLVNTLYDLPSSSSTPPCGGLP